MWGSSLVDTLKDGVFLIGVVVGKDVGCLEGRASLLDECLLGARVGLIFHQLILTLTLIFAQS